MSLRALLVAVLALCLLMAAPALQACGEAAACAMQDLKTEKAEAGEALQPCAAAAPASLPTAQAAPAHLGPARPDPHLALPERPPKTGMHRL